MRNDEDIDLLFPEDDIPEGLHFEDVDETEKQDTLTQLEFVHWLTEGRHDCEVAYTLLQAWTSFFKSSGNDALPDFFAELVHEEELTKKSAPAQDTPSVTHPPDSVEKHEKVFCCHFSPLLFANGVFFLSTSRRRCRMRSKKRFTVGF